jgi:hypothetical protein
VDKLHGDKGEKKRSHESTAGNVQRVSKERPHHKNMDTFGNSPYVLVEKTKSNTEVFYELLLRSTKVQEKI